MSTQRAPTDQRPILVLIDPSFPPNRYAAYLVEILRAEGFGSCRVEMLADVSPTLLAEAGVVILTPSWVPPFTVDLLDDYVRGGGCLVAIRPTISVDDDLPLAALLGLAPTYTGLVDAYLRIDTSSPLGQGFLADALQIHGVANSYHLAGAAAVAWLCTEPGRSTHYPAVALNRRGRGSAVTFAYDLAAAVAGLRQGNPALIDTPMCGTRSIRPPDRFVGWFDPSRWHLPQADLQTALLARVLDSLCPQPLPRLWHLPGRHRSLVVATSDGEGAPIGGFREILKAVEGNSGHISFYLLEATQVSPAEEAEWRARGHSTNMHPYLVPYPSLPMAEEVLRHHHAAFAERFGHASRTVRHHGLRFVGYTETAAILARLGIRMDLNFVSMRPAKGYMCGSAFPMKFVDQSGAIVDLWQQPTQFEDDCVLEDSVKRRAYSFQLSTDEAVALATGLIRDSIDHFHTPVVFNVHPPFYVVWSGEFFRRSLAYARENSVPIWSAEEWLDFTEARAGAAITGSRFADGRLSFRLEDVPSGVRLSFILPSSHSAGQLQEIRQGGRLCQAEKLALYGKPYALVEPAAPGAGEFTAIYGGA